MSNINWKYKWDDEEKKHDTLSIYIISGFMFLAGAIFAVFNKIVPMVFMMTLFIYLQMLSWDLLKIDKLNKLLKKRIR